MMKTFKRIICFLLALVSVLFVGCTNRSTLPNTTQISSLITDTAKEKNKLVYIKEGDTYAPYLVIENNYNGNTLLLRKNTLAKTRRMNTSGTVYENSLIDNYLNNEYYESLSNEVKDKIAYTAFNTYSKEKCENMTEEDWLIADDEKFICNIKRKVFLLAAADLEKDVSERYEIYSEGTVLDFFKNKKNFIAYTDEENREINWWLRDSFGICVDEVFFDNTEYYTEGRFMLEKLSVRPAFCVPNNTIVQRTTDIIKGKSVYTII